LELQEGTEVPVQSKDRPPRLRNQHERGEGLEETLIRVQSKREYSRQAEVRRARE